MVGRRTQDGQQRATDGTRAPALDIVDRERSVHAASPAFQALNEEFAIWFHSIGCPCVRKNVGINSP